MSTSSNIEHKLTQLKLSRIREVYGSWIAQAEQHQLGYAEFLDELSVLKNPPPGYCLPVYRWPASSSFWSDCRSMRRKQRSGVFFNTLNC